jgi:hypothetical protein
VGKLNGACCVLKGALRHCFWVLWELDFKKINPFRVTLKEDALTNSKATDNVGMSDEFFDLTFTSSLRATPFIDLIGALDSATGADEFCEILGVLWYDLIKEKYIVGVFKNLISHAGDHTLNV